MLFRRLLPMLAAGLVLLGLTAGAVPQVNAERIEALITDLASPDEAVREAALRRLVEMGDVARELLEAQIDASEGVAAMLNQIEINRIAGPTLVTLELNDVSAEEAVEELFRQSGNYFPRHSDESLWQQAQLGRVTATFKDEPFWVAMREICIQAGLYLNASGDIVLAPLSSSPPGSNDRSDFIFPVSYDGAFIVVVTGLHRNNVADLHLPETIRRDVHIRLQIMAEPRVDIIHREGVQLVEAVDEKGNSLLPRADQRWPQSSSMVHSPGWTVNMPLHYPEEAGQRIARLRGSIAVRVQTDYDRIEFENVSSARDVRRVLGDREFGLQELTRPSETEYRVMVVAPGPVREANDLVRRSRARLLDERGRETPLVRGWPTTSRDGQPAGRFTFARRDDMGEPAKLVLEIPVATRDININFEFTDLPLP
jgi:hypothetical protein